ncbi:hypothetical protein VTN00DRAFT_8328 [Thermoascus crustaceus]|uniref:uncharacterized protein n=1 Tax=Thermoascus crustaceus TaxID=5088 RepID=UPI003743D189
MGPMLFNPVSDGPAMVLSPPQDHAFVQFPSQSMRGTASGGLQPYGNDRSPHAVNGAHPSSSKFGANHSSWKSSSMCASASRKRSRDEAAFDDANGEQSYGSLNLTPTPAPAPIPEEPIYGEGMVLLNPRTGLALSAESQTGTWYEETVEQKAAAAPVSSRSSALRAVDPSTLPSRKSQRLDPSAPGLDDIALNSIRQKLQAGIHGDDNRRALNDNSSISTSFRPEEPRVDDFTHMLGISWQRIGNDDDLAPAVRGWEKYINNHYSRHLQGAQILLKHRGLNAYLVSARPVGPSGFQMNGEASVSFYLFSDELTEAQLVGSNWDITLQNLRSSPIAFEGTEVLRAAEHTPERAVEDKGVPVNSVVGNGIPVARVTPAGGVGTGTGSGDLNGDMGMGVGMDIDA